IRDSIGAVSGVVGLAGGLGGFVLPIMFGALVDLTGIHSSAFMLLYGTVCVSLVWMYFSFKPRRAARLAAALPASNQFKSGGDYLAAATRRAS
ncbi:MAG TPA: hypothetical protein DEQ40_08815, partial [Oxalobacteraceae bacterium]|nr:hypothetical protein [Oxalobacteraceae bacterium]